VAAPLFLSYRWNEGAPPVEVAALDRELRLRGVPMWRDVRDLVPGGLNEAEAREALAEHCCGCVLYFNEAVLDSWFITSVELDGVRQRLERDEHFFVAAVFDGVGEEESEALRQLTGVNLRDFQGLILDPKIDKGEQIRNFALGLLRRYLKSVPGGPVKVKADSWNEIPWTDEAPIQLNWMGSDAGDGQLPADWELLKLALCDLKEALAGRENRILKLSANLHLSSAFLVGWEFREPTGWTIEAAHARSPVHTYAASPDPQGWKLTSRPAQNNSDILIVRICASADCARAVLRHRRGEPPARGELIVLPPSGTPERTSLNEVEVNELVAAIAIGIRATRDEHGAALTHLYLACPWTMAIALGWNYGSTGPVAVHEAIADKSNYHPNPLLLP